MPKSIDLAKIKKMLIQHGEKTIRSFAKTSHNKDVYAFVLDAQATHGSVNFRWNTLEGIAYTCTFDSYKNYTDDRLYGHRGLKYSVGDFRFEDPGNEKLEKWGMKYEEVLDILWETDEDQAEQIPAAFMDVLIQVVKELIPVLEELHLTDDFIAYAVEHDEEDMKFIPQTVSPAQLEKVFPELKAYEAYKERIGLRPPIDQAAFWCQTLADFEEACESEAVVELRRLSRHSFDVQEELVRLGEVSVPILITYLERALDQLPAQTSINDRLNVWTYQSTLIDIAKARETEISRLQAIYARLNQDRPENQDTKNTLRVLHAIDPLRFPN
ncbi:DUF4303 domain-containing protein [Cohnella faecalis]|uniref:DUF4303 domain-containing protein n=1 Tax=Cohnella faecalis TaxID=2315694 RepID=A0A398CWD9_9BACL|nr:DUF4303 domain-containing protein [Cohnella faecalis]RIE04878.1 DUF4303 domain-containing protein [Cohnella faecalis]